MILRVQDLRDLLADAPDHAPVVVPAPDHSYYFARASVDTAMYDPHDQTLAEDHGEELTPEGECGDRITVLIIG